MTGTGQTETVSNTVRILETLNGEELGSGSVGRVFESFDPDPADLDERFIVERSDAATQLVRVYMVSAIVGDPVGPPSTNAAFSDAMTRATVAYALGRELLETYHQTVRYTSATSSSLEQAARTNDVDAGREAVEARERILDVLYSAEVNTAWSRCVGFHPYLEGAANGRQEHFQVMVHGLLTAMTEVGIGFVAPPSRLRWSW